MKPFITKILIALISILPVASVAADNDIIEGAVGFMIFGDAGWGAVSNDVSIEGCKVTYVQPIPLFGVNITAKYDFDKANYKSATTSYQNSQKLFILSGDNGLQDLSIISEDGKDNSAVLMLLGVTPGKSSTLSFPLIVTMDRFKVAFADLKTQCPGIKSKY